MFYHITNRNIRCSARCAAILVTGILLLAGLPGLPDQAAGTRQALLASKARRLMKKGVIAARLAHYRLAIRYFLAARKADPDDVTIYYNLGLAEAQLPGRELRAMAWLGAYLAANPAAPNARAIRDEIDLLDVKSQAEISHLLQTMHTAASKLRNPQFVWDHSDTYYALGAIAAKYAQDGDMPHAREVIGEIKDSSITGQGVASVVSAQVGVGDLTGAIRTISREPHDMYTRDNSLESIISAAENIGNFRVAVEAAKMIKNQLISAQQLEDVAWREAQVGNISAAQKLAAHILNIPARLEADFQIASIQAKSGDIPGAQRRYRRASRDAIAGGALGSTVEGTTVKLDMTTAFFDIQLAIAESQFKAGAITAALKTCSAEIKHLKSAAFDPKWPDYAAQKKHWPFKPKFPAFFQMALDQTTDISAMQAIEHNMIVAQAKRGDITGAENIALAAQRDGCHRSMLELSIAQGLAAAHKFSDANAMCDTALQAVGQLEDKKLKNTIASRLSYGAYCLVVAPELKAGDRVEALRTLRIALKAAKLIDNPAGAYDSAGDDEMYLVLGQAKAGDIPAAEATATLIRDKNNEVNALNAIALAQSKAGDATGSRATFAAALDVASHISSKINRSVAQNTIVAHETDAGDISAAESTASLISDSTYRSFAWSHIATAQAKAGDMAGARRNFGLARDAAVISPHGYSWIASVATDQAAVGDIPGAIATAQKIFHPISQMDADAAIAEAQRKAGDLNASRKTCEAVMAAARMVPGALQRVDIIARIAVTEAKAGDTTTAEKFVNLISDPGYPGWIIFAQAAIAKVKAHPLVSKLKVNPETADPDATVYIAISPWTGLLFDKNKNDPSPLDSSMFLDLHDYLKGLPNSDPVSYIPPNQPAAQTIFNAMNDSVGKLIQARHLINTMLKAQRTQQRATTDNKN
jgi:tetratricopeptide (TPR) repeat protein